MYADSIQGFDLVARPQMMLAARRDGHDVVRGVGAFHAQHIEVTVLAVVAYRQRSILRLALASVHLVEVRTAFETADRPPARVSPFKIRMQRIADGNRA